MKNDYFPFDLIGWQSKKMNWKYLLQNFRGTKLVLLVKNILVTPSEVKLKIVVFTDPNPSSPRKRKGIWWKGFAEEQDVIFTLKNDKFYYDIKGLIWICTENIIVYISHQTHPCTLINPSAISIMWFKTILKWNQLKRCAYWKGWKCCYNIYF